MENNGLLKITRNYKMEIRAENDSVLEGLAIPFGQETIIGNNWFREIIQRGAFDGCDMTDVPFMVNHDLRKIPLARSRRNNGNSTMTLSIDELHGLRFKANLDTQKNPEASAVYSSVKRGDMDSMSWMFDIGDEEWIDLDTDLPLRNIKRFSKIWEISAVIFPAYEGTDLQARDSFALESAKKALDKAKSLEKDSRAKVFDRLIFEAKLIGGKI